MQPIKNILVPTDFSKHSEQALEYAKEIGGPLGASIHLVHVLEPMTTYGSWEGIPMDDLVGRAFEQSEQKLKEAAAESLNNVPEKYIKVLEGHPDIAINHYAAEHKIDVIIMGTHGRRGLEYILFGSTTEKVLRTAPCSVLAVRLPVGTGEKSGKHASSHSHN